jgi:hypothetical protein
MNVDPDNRCAAPTADRLKAAGFGGVRLTARDTVTNKAYIANMIANGLQVLAVVGTGDNGGYIPPQSEVILQVFNEPDIDGTAMTPSDYADLFVQWRSRPELNGRQIWAAGLASGQPLYLCQFLQRLNDSGSGIWPDAIDIHPYLKDADGLRDMATTYFNIGVRFSGLNIPITASEWFQSAGNPDEFAPFQDALNNPADGVCTVWNSFFGWCSNMSDLPGAVVDATGRCLPEGLALIAALGGDPGGCG